MTAYDYTALLHPNWHSLERLAIVIDTDGGTYPSRLQDLGALLRGTLPSLRHLALTGAPFDAELVQLLVDAPVVRHLETLNLSNSSITEAGAQLLERHIDAFTHLAELDLSSSMMPPQIARQLERAHANIIAGNSRYRDDSYDDVYDY